ncbi:Cyclic nucleotide-binding protein [Pseudocohnilembus persalinus]|uniref:Cyclic nucleotide-binding protein n=1 Tax=Pseudocohnilembus persalinus TaxID=266149 RepID=A0A0V0QCR5_PSEPJ|nr:Cyclic nucleotide-binding protein [Pseudocohnilembus persalinus]|eukprot:KRX00009.1 Cyclic nucleotide-binding protein [Pseudocohnilembus persalinus]
MEESQNTLLNDNQLKLLPTVKLYKMKSIGYIQYGAPILCEQLAQYKIGQIPLYYIVPLNPFNKKNSLFLAGFEKPLLEIYLKTGQKMKIICSQSQKDGIYQYLYSTLIGVEQDNENFNQEFHNTFDLNGIPNFKNESLILQKKILQWKNTIESIDQVVDFYIYEQQSDVYIRDKVPDFGVTGLVDPFYPTKQSGFFIWINQRLVMVDPPIYINRYLNKINLPSQLIDWVILTHCHSENDLGIFQRIIESQRMEVITTPTIINSFLSKYAKLSQINVEILRRLFKLKPVVIGGGINLNRCIIRFSYCFHQIPTLTFEITNQNKSLYYSGHTYYDPKKIFNLAEQKLIHYKRYEMLSNIKFIQHIILFDMGNTFLHSPLLSFKNIPQQIKNNIYLTDIDIMSVHSSQINKTNYVDFGISRRITIGIQDFIKVDIQKQKVMDYFKKLEILSSIDVFEGLSIKNIRDLIDVSYEEHFSQGQVVIKQNTKGTKWYVILQGKIRVQKGNFKLIFSEGEYFGESALNSDNSGLRMADCIAETEVNLLTLEKQDFWFIFGQGVESMGDNTQLTQFQMILKREFANQGEKIWKSGDRAQFAIFIQQGEFKLTNSDSNYLNISPYNYYQQYFIIDKQCQILKSGAFVGELSSLTEEQENTTTLEIVSKISEFWKIEKFDLLSFLRRNPGLFLAFGDSQYFY